MRQIYSAVLSGLVLIALFWGNCFSCPQMWLAAMQEQAHSCCHKTNPQHTQSKPTSSKQQCQTQGLQTFLKADADSEHVAVLPATLLVYAPTPRVPLAAVALPDAETAPPIPITVIRI